MSGRFIRGALTKAINPTQLLAYSMFVLEPVKRLNYCSLDKVLQSTFQIIKFLVFLSVSL
jgi:hypothetical protein